MSCLKGQTCWKTVTKLRHLTNIFDPPFRPSLYLSRLSARCSIILSRGNCEICLCKLPYKDLNSDLLFTADLSSPSAFFLLPFMAKQDLRSLRNSTHERGRQKKWNGIEKMCVKIELRKSKTINKQLRSLRSSWRSTDLFWRTPYIVCMRWGLSSYRGYVW